ncbi:hypothetical protein OKW38_002232 [Paraburkholderia sp. MM5496-R1]|uniref:hypothetical protein n=1 Tax=Paraburkholderia sp. MM5496-R1 TaxID=2991065 RepID=UPI003D1F942C
MATKPPVVHDGDYHKPLAAGDTLAYAPQLDAYTGDVNIIPYTQADLGTTRGFLLDIPRGPAAHAHIFIGQLLLVANEKVPVNWNRTIYFTVSGRIGVLNPFGIVGMPLTLSGSNAEAVEPFTLPVYAKFAAGNSDARVSIGYEVLGYNQVADGASLRYQLLGNHIF